MSVITTVVSFFTGLGSTVLVALVMMILGLVFQAGLGKSIRGGLYTGIGLAGLSLVVNNCTTEITPAITAMAERLGTNATITDVGWGAAGIAFAWPGFAFVIVAVLVVNAILVLLGVVKTMFTDIWSQWHGNVLAGFVWAMTGGNITMGVIAGVLYSTFISFCADWTAKDYQEFNQLPGIGIPCSVSILGVVAKPVNALFDKIPGFNKVNLEPAIIRKKLGFFGELGVMGFFLGLVIGVIAGLPLASVCNLGIQMGLVMVLLPKAVSILCEGAISIANSITEFIQDHTSGKKELYVGVDCAALLGHPSVMAASVLLYPLTIFLAIILPGNGIIPIASLAMIPYWSGAVAAQFKGNVFRIVIFVLLWTIPVLYIATYLAPIQTAAMAACGLADANVINTCYDPAGDPVALLIIKVFQLFA